MLLSPQTFCEILVFSKNVSCVITVHHFLHNSSKASGDETLDFIQYIYFVRSVRKHVSNGEKESKTSNEEKIKKGKRIKD